MILVDTSVWIEVMRRRDPLDLVRTVVIDEVVTCLPVIQEILQGISDPGAYRVAHGALFALPILENPLGSDVFVEAADLFRAARRAGLSVRSSVDCLIAACAIRHDVTVLHRDRDFSSLARVSQLREKRVRISVAHIAASRHQRRTVRSQLLDAAPENPDSWRLIDATRASSR
jgi:predicted nucleic acid-binding protein